MPSSHLILCHPLLLLLPIPPSIRVFSDESTLRMRWPRYWSFSFSIIPSKEIPGLISFRMDWVDQGLDWVSFFSVSPRAQFPPYTFLIPVWFWDHNCIGAKTGGLYSLLYRFLAYLAASRPYTVGDLLPSGGLKQTLSTPEQRQ